MRLGLGVTSACPITIETVLCPAVAGGEARFFVAREERPVDCGTAFCMLLLEQLALRNAKCWIGMGTVAS